MVSRGLLYLVVFAGKPPTVFPGSAPKEPGRLAICIHDRVGVTLGVSDHLIL